MFFFSKEKIDEYNNCAIINFVQISLIKENETHFVNIVSNYPHNMKLKFEYVHANHACTEISKWLIECTRLKDNRKMKCITAIQYLMFYRQLSISMAKFKDPNEIRVLNTNFCLS